MSQLSSGHVSLALTVESLESLVEVGEGASVFFLADVLVDGQKLFQFVRLLAYTGRHTDMQG